jgi:predicted ATPase
MLTRLKVSGFKNLVDVDVHFGPFTCIAGANGIGKSNLFDAITFLSSLADRPLVDAALSVRDEEGRSSDLRGIFHRTGEEFDPLIRFEAEMIVPVAGLDDLGQPAHASITFLRYIIQLAYRGSDGTRSPGALELLKEELNHITRGEAKEHLPFPHSQAWRDSAIQGRRTSPLISTEGSGLERVIKLHQDGVPGRPLSRAAASLPRTVLSSTNAAESPTALMARREMQSWRLLQLEPLALRRPDQFTAPTRLGIDGSHLPATLYHLAKGLRIGARIGSLDEEAVYTRVANRLAELIGDVGRVWVDRDDRRELLTLMVSDREGTEHSARALSDGTMRFLALAVLDVEPTLQGLLCLEEPENGIHPARIPSMLRLLQDIATDTDYPVGPDNPLRQVIVNTHSPSVVRQVLDENLLVAEPREYVVDGKRFKGVRFGSLPGTWGEKVTGESVPRGMLLDYLNPDVDSEDDRRIVVLRGEHGNGHAGRTPARVMDRPDMQQMLFRVAPEDE